MEYKTTKDVNISKKLIGQVIGQEESINIIKKAALQRRHVLLIGEPGTGKSMLGLALAELLPNEKLQDILVFPNPKDENHPLVRTMPKGKGKELVEKLRIEQNTSSKNQSLLFLIIVLALSMFPYYLWKTGQISDVIFAASMISSMVLVVGVAMFMNISKRIKIGSKIAVPKLLLDNSGAKRAPFHDATGAHAGALLGDCLHDPLQSFSSSNSILILNPKTRQIKEARISNKVNSILKDYKNKIIKEGKYQAVHLDKGTLKVLGEAKGKIRNSEVLSVNKYQFNGNLTKITTNSGRTLVVTPEHKVAVKSLFGKKWVEAAKLKKHHKLYRVD